MDGPLLLRRVPQCSRPPHPDASVRFRRPSSAARQPSRPECVSHALPHESQKVAPALVNFRRPLYNSENEHFSEEEGHGEMLPPPLTKTFKDHARVLNTVQVIPHASTVVEPGSERARGLQHKEEKTNIRNAARCIEAEQATAASTARTTATMRKTLFAVVDVLTAAGGEVGRARHCLTLAVWNNDRGRGTSWALVAGWQRSQWECTLQDVCWC